VFVIRCFLFHTFFFEHAAIPGCPNMHLSAASRQIAMCKTTKCHHALFCPKQRLRLLKAAVCIMWQNANYLVINHSGLSICPLGAQGLQASPFQGSGVHDLHHVESLLGVEPSDSIQGVSQSSHCQAASRVQHLILLLLPSVTVQAMSAL